MMKAYQIAGSMPYASAKTEAAMREFLMLKAELKSRGTKVLDNIKS